MRTCIVCGCTDLMACHGGCAWAQKLSKTRGVCTSCPPPAKKLTKLQGEDRARLRKAVKRANARRKSIAQQYMRADREYADWVIQLRNFESGLPL